MRSKFLMCAALAATGAFTWFGSAHAAGGKAKDKANAASAKKAAASELHADDRSMKKQLQWEDKVMGPDSKRAELDRIARATAINEKAARDKEKEQQAALDAPPAPKTRKVDARAEVAIPPTAEEKALNSDHGRSVDISPKLSTEAAAAPVPRSKPADDKFIDKLLRDNGSTSKASASKSSANDRALEELLSGAKDKPAARRSKGDKVDDLIKSADKGPAMPAPRSAAALPDWAQQPEIAPSAPPPVAMHVPAKPAKDDGVLHVVQGAAATSPAPVAARVNARKSPARPTKAAVMWNDPFADTKTVASRDRQTTPAPKKEPASRPSSAPTSEWSDPFADSPETRKTTRHTSAASPAVAPASTPKRGEKSDSNGHGSGGWKDPFTKATAEPSRTPVAMRELGKGETSKWEIATHRSASPTPHAAASPDSHVGAWGVLKKHK